MLNVTAAAQAVLDAFTDEWPWQTMPDPSESIAAAFRAAADQVVPEPSDHLPEQNCRWYRLGASAYRHNLRAIADELEGVKHGTYRSDLEDKPQ
jgi:hypothetical protein